MNEVGSEAEDMGGKADFYGIPPARMKEIEVDFRKRLEGYDGSRSFEDLRAEVEAIAENDNERYLCNFMLGYYYYIVYALTQVYQKRAEGTGRGNVPTKPLSKPKKGGN